MQIEPTKVSLTEDGIRLDRWFLRHYPKITHIEFRKLCRKGQIRINSARCRGNEILHAEDIIRIPPFVFSSSESRASVAPKKTETGEKFSLSDLEKLRKCIIHDDDDIVAFNKPAGLAAQGGTGIKQSLDKMAPALFPHDNVVLVHRLDRETSGVIVMAKNQKSAQILASEFQNKGVAKEYIALLSGSVKPKHGVIDNFMVKGQVLTEREAAAYQKTTGTMPRRAITKYNVTGELPGMLSWIQFFPSTGRTHQLRLHSAFSLNAPIVGDSIYGGNNGGARMDPVLGPLLSTKNLFLCAYRISFRHPATGKIITIKAELPDFMQSVAKFLEFKIE